MITYYDYRLPGAVVNNRVILIRHCIEHSQLVEHIRHDIQEVLTGSPLHDSTKQRERVSGVQKSSACMEHSIHLTH